MCWKKYKIEEIRKFQVNHGIWCKISNNIGSIIIYFFQKLDFSPHVITLFSVIFGISGVMFLLKGHLITFALFIQLMYLLDNMDGQWARLKNKTSKLGALLDSFADQINIVSIYLSIAYYLFTKYKDEKYLFFALLIFALMFMFFAFAKKFVELYGGQTTVENTSIKKMKTKLDYIKNLVYRLFAYDKSILLILVLSFLDRLEYFLVYEIFKRLFMLMGIYYLVLKETARNKKENDELE